MAKKRNTKPEEASKEENELEETGSEEIHQEEHSHEEAVQVPVEADTPAPSVEMVVEDSVVKTRVFPQIRVGVCEFHGTPYGVIDFDTLRGRCWHSCKNDPLCPHNRAGGCDKYQDPVTQEPAIRPGEVYCRHEHNYKGLSVRCSYCPIDADMRGVLKQRTLYVYQSPENESKLIMVCSDYRCQNKHQRRFSQQVV